MMEKADPRTMVVQGSVTPVPMTRHDSKLMTMKFEYGTGKLKHCRTCGTPHQGKWCPPDAFRIIKCSCGNECLIPCDALVFGFSDGYCGQCGKNTGWQSPVVPTVDDMKRLWKGYGDGPK